MEEQLTIAPLPWRFIWRTSCFMQLQTPRRLTWVTRVDLIDRVLEKAKLLQQGPNNFVNLCVEGVLDAMDAPRSDDIPIFVASQPG